MSRNLFWDFMNQPATLFIWINQWNGHSLYRTMFKSTTVSTNQVQINHYQPIRFKSTTISTNQVQINHYINQSGSNQPLYQPIRFKSSTVSTNRVQINHCITNQVQINHCINQPGSNQPLYQPIRFISTNLWTNVHDFQTSWIKLSWSLDDIPVFSEYTKMGHLIQPQWNGCRPSAIELVAGLNRWRINRWFTSQKIALWWVASWVYKLFIIFSK